MNTPREFTVMTLNAGGGRRARQCKLVPSQLARDIARVLRNVGIVPDIIAVQEAHRVHPRRSETSAELAERLTSQHRAFFAPYLDSESHSHPNKWQEPAFRGYQRVEQGNAIISRFDLTDWPWRRSARRHPGSGKPRETCTQISRASLYSTGNRDTEPRNLLVAPIQIGDPAGDESLVVYFMATHLTTLTEERDPGATVQRRREASQIRSAQTKEILRVVNELRKAEAESGLAGQRAPIILAGDFNAVELSPEIQNLKPPFTIASPVWSGPSSTPVYTHRGHKIHVDYVFCNDPRGLLTLTDCFVLAQSDITLPGQQEPVTDHLPVVAKFQF